MSNAEKLQESNFQLFKTYATEFVTITHSTAIKKQVRAIK